MTFAASFSPSPQPQIYTNTLKRPLKLNPKSHKNLVFLFSSSSSAFFKPSLSSTTTFPLNLKTPSNPVQFHPLSDSIHDNLVEDLEKSANSHIPINEICQITPLESSPRIFIQDPPWIASIFLKGLYKRANQEVKLEYKEMEKRKYNLLRRRQIKAETEAWERMVEEYRELEREMCEKKLAPNLPYVKALFLGWFEPLRDAIEKEQKTQRTKKHKAAFAPHIDLLPADKMAVIVMHKMMGLFMMGNQEGYVQVVQAAIQIGVAIEQEVRIHSFLEKTKNSQSKKIVADTEDGLHKEKQILRKRVNSLIRKRKLKEAQKLLKKEEFKPWGQDTQAKLGSRLIELLTETAYVQPPLNQSADGPPDIRPAFRHKFKPVTKNPGHKIVKNYGIIECDPLILPGLDKTDPGVLKCRGRNEEFQKRSPMVDDRVLDIVKRIGLEGLYRTPFREIDHNLITAFVEQWRVETHTFHLPHGEMTITLQDVEVLLGIPIDGEAIVGTTHLTWAVECQQMLGIVTNSVVLKGQRIQIKKLLEKIDQGLPDGAEEVAVHQYARCYILALLGDTIFVDKSGDKVHTMWL